MYGRFRINNKRNFQQPSGSSGIIKRHRDSLVCSQCRKAKLRCDRARPCGNCIKRNEDDLCRYHTSTDRRNDADVTSSAEDKLQHLESVVRQLMQHEALTPPDDAAIVDGRATHATPPSDVTNEVEGSPSKGKERSGAFAGPTHWSSVLEDINEIRLAINGAAAATTGTEVTPGPHDFDAEAELIFGSSSVDTVPAIVAQYLPAKVQIDRYLSIYFSGETYIIAFIHTYHFQKEYKEFWHDIPKADPLWLSILFSICYMATLIGGATNSYRSMPTGSPVGEVSLHEAAGKCLVLGQYHKPQPYVVEALALYALSKNMRSLDPSRPVGTIFSIVVRLAYQMGYHRESDKSGPYTVFEAEMRRRTWAAIKQMDLMVSFQHGLPSNIRMGNSDTRSPSHLLDSDFDSSTMVLPEPRPDTQWSKILWFIIKDQQMASFAKVWSKVLSFETMTEAEVMAMDRDIREIHQSTPLSLRVRAMADSIADSSFLILTRLYIEFIHQKTLCILHRKYMTRGHATSTKACLEAGRQIVEQFIDIHKEFSAGGQLDGERWMLSNFTVNDYLLGLSILCLFMHAHRNSKLPLASRGSQSIDDIRHLLQQSHQICIEKLASSRDAARVAQAIDLTLKGTSAEMLPGGDVASDRHYALGRSIGPEHGVTFRTLEDAPTMPWFNIDPMIDMSWMQFDPLDFVNHDFQDIDWTAFETDVAE